MIIIIRTHIFYVTVYYYYYYYSFLIQAVWQREVTNQRARFILTSSAETFINLWLVFKYYYCFQWAGVAQSV